MKNLIFQEPNNEYIAPSNINTNFLITEQNFHNNRQEQINSAKYITNFTSKRPLYQEEPFNAKITFGPNNFVPFEDNQGTSGGFDFNNNTNTGNNNIDNTGICPNRFKFMIKLLLKFYLLNLVLISQKKFLKKEKFTILFRFLYLIYHLP